MTPHEAITDSNLFFSKRVLFKRDASRFADLWGPLTFAAVQAKC